MKTFWEGSSFSKDAIEALLIRMISIVAGFVFTSSTSFMLQRTEYGELATVLSTAMFASAFGEFGQRDLTSREISRSMALGRKTESVNFALWSTQIVCLSGFIVSLVSGLVLVVAGFSVLLSISSSLLTFSLCLDGPWSGAGRAFGQLFWAIAPRDILWRSASSLIIYLLFILGFRISALLATVILFICMGSSSCVQVILLKRRVSRLKELGESRRGSRRMLKASLDLAVSYVGGVMLATLDVVVVGLILGDRAAAEYYPANRVAILTLTLPITLQVVFGPLFARAFADNDLERLKRSARSGTIISFLGTVTGVSIIILGRGSLVHLFGTATNTTTTLVIILSIGSIFNAFLGFGNTLLIASGNEADLRKIMLFSAPVTAILLCLAAVLWGEVGVALAVSSISSVRLFVVAICCRRRLGFSGGCF